MTAGGLFLAALLLFEGCSPGLFSSSFEEEDVARTNDATAPVVTIDSPEDGDPYAPIVTVTGAVTDSAGDGAHGKVRSASYALEGTAVSGDIPLGNEGSFNFDFSTDGITGTVTLKITAKDWNDNVAETQISLVAPKEITWFGFLAEENPELEVDVQGSIAETTVSVNMPGSLDISALVATFECTGVEVYVGTVIQESGRTPNDYSDPVVFTVVSNDGTKKQYTVTVSAKPLQPSQFRVDDSSTSAITLAWTDNATNETHYVLQRAIDSTTDFANIEELPKDTSTFTDIPPTVGSYCSYRVCAGNEQGRSSWTTIVQHRSWVTTEVDSSGDTGFQTAIAISPSGEPAICYTEVVGWDLDGYYALAEESAWSHERASIGAMPSLTVASDGSAHISSVNTEGLWYSTRTGTGWNAENVDGTTSVAANDIDLTSDMRPFISYYDTSNDNLKCVFKSGEAWVTEVVDSSGSVGDGNSIAVDDNGNVHIAYSAYTNGDLKYAQRDGASWTTETVDSSASVGGCTDLAVDSAGRPHIAYRDNTNGTLRYARWNGSEWIIETVDESSNVEGNAISMDLDEQDNAYVCYRNAALKDLMIAKRDGMDWNVETVDGTEDVGTDCSIALDASGIPHLSYRDNANKSLKYAVWSW